MPTEIAPGVLSWASAIDANTVEQAARTARLPVVRHPVALMPDAHLGIGATVGSVVATRGAILPAAVGVDIGCGMIATQLDLRTDTLAREVGADIDSADARDPSLARPAIADRLGPLHAHIRDLVPAGMGRGNDGGDRTHGLLYLNAHPAPSRLSEQEAATAVNQFGSLGGGNHFVEVCSDVQGRVWLMLHSGSRGIGNRLASHHIDVARDLFPPDALEDRDLAYFREGTPEFAAYVADMLWAQDWAHASRQLMADRVHAAVEHLLDRYIPCVQTINVHHNYAVQEEHDGETLWVTRKGATRAGAGEYGIIPGSMATGSFIVRGHGEPASYESCSHGAGRRMSRGQARRELTPESLAERMAGKVWQDRDAEALVDEHPDSYKDLGQVMRDQLDLVAPVAQLTAMLNYKGVEPPRGKRRRP